MTELAASTGALIKVLKDSAYGFDKPEAISSDGNDVWVTNPPTQSGDGAPGVLTGGGKGWCREPKGG